ncbi:MAG TPA: hypothetical protein VNZ22_11160 [Bacillota bacterium]|nr:hypothetical protein [Bacillota bacterium]
MPTTPRILYCHCTYAQVVPRDVREAVLQALCQSGLAFEAVADLCELSARKDPRLQQLAQGGGLRVAACYPRAVRWLFAAAAAPLPEGTQIVNLRVEAAEEARAMLVGAAGQPGEPKGGSGAPTASPEQTFGIIQALLEQGGSLTCDAGGERFEFQGGGRSPKAAATEGGVEGEAPAAAGRRWKPWFPVVDFERCTNCMQCLSFCLFGVYGVDAQQRISVQAAENCKTNCPACSRVCPEAAIIFPKYKAGPINGDVVTDSDVQREKLKVDISALLGGDVYTLLRERSKKRFSTERDPDQALQERQRWMAKLVELGDIPPEVLMSLPSPEEIQRRAEAAKAKAQAFNKQSES